jgi:GNAT superfamily N-acetyltransferase
MKSLYFLLLLWGMSACGMDHSSSKRVDNVSVDQVITFAHSQNMSYHTEKVRALADELCMTCEPDQFFDWIIHARCGSSYAGMIVFKRDRLVDLKVECEFRSRGIARALLLAAFYVICKHSHKSYVRVEWFPFALGEKGVSQEQLVEFYETFGASRGEYFKGDLFEMFRCFSV